MILLTGGAGYIGAHIVRELEKNNRDYLVLDDLSTGNAALVPTGRLCVGNIGDRALLASLFARYAFDTVIHCAAKTSVPESLERPLYYYQENVGLSLALLAAAAEAGSCRYFIFSSSAAVYAINHEPLLETDLCQPLTPYGHSKLIFEQMLADCAKQSGMQYAILRYFNVAGASEHIGPSEGCSTNLFQACLQVLQGKQKQLCIHGSDYDTADGTCVRDFIHVRDLAKIHCDILSYLEQNPQMSYTLNCGYGKGFSVDAVVQCFSRYLGYPLPHYFGPRRLGDAPSVIANCSQLQAMHICPSGEGALERIVSDLLAYAKIPLKKPRRTT